MVQFRSSATPIQSLPNFLAPTDRSYAEPRSMGRLRVLRYQARRPFQSVNANWFDNGRGIDVRQTEFLFGSSYRHRHRLLG